MKILIIQQKMIGDVLTSSILFEALRQKYTKAQLDYLINEHTFPVVENNPFIDNYILFTKNEETNKMGLLKLTKAIKKEKYDVVIDVYSKLSSNIITALSGAKTKISYRKYYTTLIYHHNIIRLKNDESTNNLAVANRLKLLKPLGLEIDSIKPKIYLKDSEIESSKNILIKHNIVFEKPLYMVSAMGSSKNKSYPLEYMALVIDFIVEETSGQILFNYMPNQKEEASTLYNLCKPETQKKIYPNILGKNLREFLALTQHCNALIGNEGGAVNMAKALNIPTFTIFSPWIDKGTWSLFENQKNVSVHLKDFKPELYMKPEKKYKNESLTLYKVLKPELFLTKLKTFLSDIQ